MINSKSLTLILIELKPNNDITSKQNLSKNILLFLYFGHFAIKSSVSYNNPKALIIRGTIYSYNGIDTGIIGPYKIIY